MVLLDPDAFLTQLTRILERSRDTGTIYVTFKRCAFAIRARARALPLLGSTLPNRLDLLWHASSRSLVPTMCAARVHVVAGPAGAAKAASAASSDDRPFTTASCAPSGRNKDPALITAKNYQLMQSYGNILKVSMDREKREKKRLEKRLDARSREAAAAATVKGGQPTRRHLT